MKAISKTSHKSGGVIFRFDTPEPHVLVIIEDDHSFGLPKGKQKKNESKLQTGVRESIEESGIWNLPEPVEIGVRVIQGQEIHWFAFGISFAPKHSNAHEAIRWVALSQLDSYLKKDQKNLVLESLEKLQ